MLGKEDIFRFESDRRLLSFLQLRSVRFGWHYTDLKKGEGWSLMATQMKMKMEQKNGDAGRMPVVKIKVSNGMEFISLVWLAGCLLGWPYIFI